MYDASIFFSRIIIVEVRQGSNVRGAGQAGMNPLLLGGRFISF